jgi:hypothetical protein
VFRVCDTAITVIFVFVSNRCIVGRGMPPLNLRFHSSLCRYYSSLSPQWHVNHPVEQPFKHGYWAVNNYRSGGYAHSHSLQRHFSACSTLSKNGALQKIMKEKKEEQANDRSLSGGISSALVYACRSRTSTHRSGIVAGENEAGVKK